MSEGEALMRMLKAALHDATGGIRERAGLPRITVFDPPPKQRRKSAWRISKRTVALAEEQQLTLL